MDLDAYGLSGVIMLLFVMPLLCIVLLMQLFRAWIEFAEYRLRRIVYARRADRAGWRAAVAYWPGGEH